MDLRHQLRGVVVLIVTAPIRTEIRCPLYVRSALIPPLQRAVMQPRLASSTTAAAAAAALKH